MSVVSAAQFKLVRARKQMEKAHRHHDWADVRSWDEELASCLDEAFDDDTRDVKSLIGELENVLHLYADIVADLPTESIRVTTPQHALGTSTENPNKTS